MTSFENVRGPAKANAEAILCEWFPEGRKEGWEFCIADVSGNAGSSLKYHLRKHVWSDFATGETGDIFSLIARKEGISDYEAAIKISDKLKIGDMDKTALRGSFSDKRRSPVDDWISTRDVYEGAPPPPDSHPYHGIPSKIWTYHNEEGDPIGYVYRFDTEAGKQIVPLTWCVNQKTQMQEWRWKHFQFPRPLYNLHELSKRMDAKVIVVEGEKAADAAKILCPDAVVVTWPGGSNAINSVDWSQLEDRSVIIWPDEDHKIYKDGEIPAKGFKIGDEKPIEDQPGYKAALKIKAIIPSSRIVSTSGKKPDGWDAADALASGATIEQCQEFLGIHEAEEENEYVPTNRQLERLVLAEAICGDKMEVMVAEGVSQKWFTEKDHKFIWKCALSIFEAQKTIDINLLASYIQKLIQFGDWSGDLNALLATIKKGGGKFDAYFQQIKEEKLKRDIRINFQRGAMVAQMENMTLSDIKKETAPILAELFSTTSSHSEKTAKERVSELIEKKVKEMKGEQDAIPMENRVHLGIGKVDERFGFVDRYEKDNLIVIGAPTSCGKSALMRQILFSNIFIHSEWVCVAFLLESSIEDFCHNGACSFAKINTRGNLSQIDGSKQKNYHSYLKQIEKTVDDRLFLFDGNASMDEIQNRCAEIRAKCGRIDLVFMDYIQIASRERRSGNSESEVAAISRGIKMLQKELHCPIFTGTQLNEQGEVRESRTIEQDATRFWKMERPDKDPNDAPQGEGYFCSTFYQTIYQKKYRNGPKVKCDLCFDVTTQRIIDWI